jgi:preprotein translocase subunit SecY
VFVTMPLLCTDHAKWRAIAAATGAFFNVLNPAYWLIFAVLLIPITFFYNDVYFTNQNYAERLKRTQAQIPGVHSGQATECYLQRIMRAITLPYCLLLVAVAVLPYLAIRAFDLGISPMLGVSIFLLVAITREGFLTLEAVLKLLSYEEKLLIS